MAVTPTTEQKESSPDSGHGGSLCKVVLVVVLAAVSVSIGCGGGGSSSPSVATSSGRSSGSSGGTSGTGGSGGGTNTGNATPAQYFGLQAGEGIILSGEPWPTVPFGDFRLIGNLTQWRDLNPSEGVFDFTNLDLWLTKIQTEGPQSPAGYYDVIYTFFDTPTWAAANPNQSCNGQKTHPPGSCSPPSDLNPDGTGTNQHWKDFVTAIATHVHSSSPGIIKEWEIWNEPNNAVSWQGTIPQLVRMAKDASTIIKGIDPQARITTPTPVSLDASQTNSSGTQTPAAWLQQYLPAAVAGGAIPDIITFHGYVLGSDQVEGVQTLADSVTALRSSSNINLSSKPVWDTEAGFRTDLITDEDDQAAWLARFYLLQWSRGIQRAYWYRWDTQNLGWLWDSATGIRKPGVAYGEVFKWMVGNTLSTSCSANGSVWTCGFTQSGSSYQALAVWDASQSCSSGTCTTSGYTPNDVYINYRDLEGNLTSFTAGSMIQIGAKPILLQNQ